MFFCWSLKTHTHTYVYIYIYTYWSTDNQAHKSDDLNIVESWLMNNVSVYIYIYYHYFFRALLLLLLLTQPWTQIWNFGRIWRRRADAFRRLCAHEVLRVVGLLRDIWHGIGLMISY